MIIYLVRHGQDDDSCRGGWSHHGLTQEGVAQARRPAERVDEKRDDFLIRSLIISDLERAAETATEIGARLGLEVEYSPEWRETSNGILAGMPSSIADRFYPHISFTSLAMDERFPGGESSAENYQRIKIAWENLCDSVLSWNAAPNVMLVTHRRAINIVYYLVKGLPWTNKALSFQVDTWTTWNPDLRSVRGLPNG
ncbi:MAG: histidine phosphatase family protein [Bacillota bacterium]